MSDVTRITHISKSRKDHKCDFCTSTIPVGSSYVRNSGYGKAPVLPRQFATLVLLTLTSATDARMLGEMVN